MNLHEYQAKQLFREFQLPTPNGVTVDDVSEVDAAIAKIPASKWVVKAQVHAGGRGKAGGVKVLGSKAEVKDMVTKMIGTDLVTFQTGGKGLPINTMLIEEPCDIERELYLGVVIDRACQKIVLMASTEGGMEIEKVADETPDKILKVTIEPAVGVMPFQTRELAYGLNLTKTQTSKFIPVVSNLVKMFIDKDLSLLEINPLVTTKQDDVLCLDGKINIDSNALYRQPQLVAMRDFTQEDEMEAKEAAKWELNYIALDGNVGCMVNGAGLAMATMDLIKLHGGEPANFLDVGGGATAERVAVALEIILSNKDVKSILVNIFGGIVRCDLIADGIIEAVSKTAINVPLIVRLEGNNAKLGLGKLASCNLNIVVANSLTKAAQLAIEASGNKK